jgi:hypothetical protein
MSINVCISPSKGLDYLNGGGALWIYLNWALGLRALGCQVIWMEGVAPSAPAGEVRARVATLKEYLEPQGLAACVALLVRRRAAARRVGRTGPRTVGSPNSTRRSLSRLIREGTCRV